MSISTKPPNYINHVVIVADESSSMWPHSTALVKVVDGQIAYLAQRSKEWNQETRITVYVFGSRGTARCLIYDMDVLRVPSIAGLYKPNGMTALIDTVLLAIGDLSMTPEKYGEHAFLIYTVTDGQENNSSHRPAELAARIEQLPGHWTLAAFVPDQRAVFEAKKCGFPADNIAVWDTTNAQGIVEVGETIRRTSESFMEGRSRGVRGSRNLFTVNEVTPAAAAATLTPLTPGSYFFADVEIDGRIDEFVAMKTGRPYQAGTAYYQLTKAENIQAYKKIAILTPDGSVYSGAQARTLLGLPGTHEMRVMPTHQPGTKIFVQSTSHNRKLIGGTRLLVLR